MSCRSFDIVGFSILCERPMHCDYVVHSDDIVDSLRSGPVRIECDVQRSSLDGDKPRQLHLMQSIDCLQIMLWFTTLPRARIL